MVAHSLRTAAIGALLALASPAAAGGPAVEAPTAEALPSALREAGDAVDAFHAALGRGDTEAASALLADDVLIFEEGRAERSKAEYALHHLGADAEYSRAVASTKGLRRAGMVGDMAWVATEGRTKGRFRGAAVNRVTVETMLLQRVDGAWKIVHIHWSSAESSVE